MNIAALWKLAAVFMLEHNHYGLTVHHTAQRSIEDLSVRGAGYGIPSVTVDGNAVRAGYQAAAQAVARASAGDGRSLIEAKTYRVEGFSTSDMGGYQDPAEIAYWRERDPIRVSFEQLKQEAGEARLLEIDRQATDDIRDAVDAALSDPFPTFEVLAGSLAHSVVCGWL